MNVRVKTPSVDTVQWLMGPDDPSVRYYTMKYLTGATNIELAAAKKAIMQEGLAPKILAMQNEEGCWSKPEDFYIRSKYKGTVWTLILLAGLGADGGDARIKNACESVLDRSQHMSGGFSYKSAKEGGGYGEGILPCLTGNMIWSMARFGFIDDPRIRKSIDWMAKYQRFDDGVLEPPKGWPYDGREKCWGRHTCHMSVVKVLKALAEIPKNMRSNAANTTIERGAEYLLAHHIYKKSHELSRISKPEWLLFGFPHMWDTDVLEILDILLSLGYRDERMQEAIDLVLKKQNEQGRWLLETTFNGRSIVKVERKNMQSKWVTLYALKVLQSYYG